MELRDGLKRYSVFLYTEFEVDERFLGDDQNWNDIMVSVEPSCDCIMCFILMFDEEDSCVDLNVL